MTNTDKTVSTERLEELAKGYETWGKTNSTQPQIDLDTASALRELLASRTQEPAEWQVEARRHAVELEQCAIFAADVGTSIAKAMTDAAAFLRAASISPPAQGRSKEEVDIEATAKNIARNLSAIDGGRFHGPTYNAAKAGAIEGLKCGLSALETPSLHKVEGHWSDDKTYEEAPAPLPVGEEEDLLALIREEAGKDNSPLGRSDSLAIRRIRTVLGLDPHSGAALAKPGEQ